MVSVRVMVRWVVLGLGSIRLPPKSFCRTSFLSSSMTTWGYGSGWGLGFVLDYRASASARRRVTFRVTVAVRVTIRVRVRVMTTCRSW